MEFVVEIIHDAYMGPPWKEHDGHGPVSDWTSRHKAAGELLLSEDRGCYQYYDYAEACKIALKDGWDAEPLNKNGRETPRQQAAKAARADYEYLRQWCDNVWCWVCILVRRKGDCPTCGKCVSVCGVESSAEDYIQELIEELKTELIAELEKED